jgi:hypothetical protein
MHAGIYILITPTVVNTEGKIKGDVVSLARLQQRNDSNLHSSIIADAQSESQSLLQRTICNYWKLILHCSFAPSFIQNWQSVHSRGMDIFSDGRNFQAPQILEHNNGTAGPHGHKYVDNF